MTQPIHYGENFRPWFRLALTDCIQWSCVVQKVNL